MYLFQEHLYLDGLSMSPFCSTYMLIRVFNGDQFFFSFFSPLFAWQEISLLDITVFDVGELSPKGFMCLSTQSPVGGAVWKGCAALSRWILPRGRHRGRGQALRLYSLTLLPVDSLLPENKSNVTSQTPAPVTSHHVFSAMTGHFLVELWTRINPLSFKSLLLDDFITATERITLTLHNCDGSLWVSLLICIFLASILQDNDGRCLDGPVLIFNPGIWHSTYIVSAP